MRGVLHDGSLFFLLMPNDHAGAACCGNADRWRKASGMGPGAPSSRPEISLAQLEGVIGMSAA
ncbi:hypothetical protein DM292_01740 [Stutzerimonas frequens]|nr:hypothetical protein DM292_01740 [Stutzerimonas frequens]TDL97565.1 hypothetical protein EBP26_03910 [Stutzerimonas stutzeri ATCC 17588 = LMG 11199]MBK3760351.1 hypothetical protein [Stutzerimonas frequens]MBK3874618.1 hypothetical protein [Stutzerimonas frequens]MBK3912887.1 hypothetical protein [Stutzerimonas frequens]